MSARTLNARAGAPERGLASRRPVASKARRTTRRGSEGAVRVIVAFNGSSAGYAALRLGALLVAPADSELVVACAFPPESLAGLPFEPRATRVSGGDHRVFTRQDAEATLAEARTALGEDFPTSFRALECESAAEGLRQLALREGADVLVIGSTHTSPAAWLLEDSVARRLLRHAPCAIAVASADRHEAIGPPAGGKSAAARTAPDEQGADPPGGRGDG